MNKRSLVDRICQSQLWRSVFRHGPPQTPRSRSLTVVSNFFLHLHPVTLPRHALRITYTWGLGGISFLLFLILTASGVLLMFYYVPDVGRAYEDMRDLEFAVPFGLFLRNIHRWSAHAMVLTVILHMMRVFYTAAYRPPREFNWVLGVLLLVLTLLMSFTGYLLPWDQLAYWAITVGTNMARATPFIGHAGPFHDLLGVRIDNDIRFALLGGTTVGQNALIRFYTLHCIAIPLGMGLLLAIHFWRIRKDGGISGPEPRLRARAAAELAPSMAATAVPAGPSPTGSNPSPDAAEPRYRLLAFVPGQTYSGKRDRGPDEVQVWPHLVARELLATLAVIVAIWILALCFNAPLEAKANPALTPNPAKAPWYFVGLQELLAYFDPWIAGVMVPMLIIFGLAAIPYLDVNRRGVGQYALGQRKFAVTVFTCGCLLWFTLIFIGLLLRGPSWAWYWPWQDWTVPKETVSRTWPLPAAVGYALFVLYFFCGLVLPAYLARSFYKALGPARYCITMVLLLLMIGVPLKILLRLAFGIKYVLTTPWFNV